MDLFNGKRIKIVFTDNAFDKELERAGLHDCKRYTTHVAEMNKLAEAIDRYDDFSSLALKPSDYAQSGNSEYGIKKEKYHLGDERLLPHQNIATKAFLKDLRGFGLLADVVGSGKTYEACAVLSELSARGKIDSLLLIVPSQVYNTWIEVLEVKFGLGKGVLKTIDSSFDEGLFERSSDGFIRPLAPIIVKADDFVKWKEHDVYNVLFDVVVVDEAHNLCCEEGENARAMKLLSIMMQTKKQANKTYCVLLSATPHSGNLENMFRLWYFIRCKGGLPEDFDEKDDTERTKEYRKEKEYYIQHICRGATTVMDFINTVTMAEVTGRYIDSFSEFLESKNKNINAFNNLLDGEKKKYIAEFLEKKYEIRERVNDSVARAYHNGVLRSIMIRQPNDRIRKGKRIENYYFFPSNNSQDKVEIEGLKKEKVLLNTLDLYGDTALEVDNEQYSIEDYVKAKKEASTYRKAYADLFFGQGILNGFGLTDDAFEKRNSLKYYWRGLTGGKRSTGSASGEEDVLTQFVPMGNKDCFDAKLEKLQQLLDKHSNQRVIIFFDYDLKKNERCVTQVLDYLKNNSKYASRIIVGDNVARDKTEQTFNAKADAILVVTDNAFTEGANLQKSNVIVNFQVTPNPLAMEQRIGRIFRLGQENDVIIYSFADMRKLEGYVLMYFSNIGLLTSNSGDAAIIAGANNDNMVTIRCRGCGQVKLLSKDDYETYKKNDTDDIYCNANAQCTLFNARGTVMEEINSNEMKCSTCGNVIKRGDINDGGQYYCLAINNTGSGIMCNAGERGDRRLYCRKICAIAHCNRFTSGVMAGKCEALKYYLENPNASEADLEDLCENCPSAGVCLPKCRVRFGSDAIRGCSTCDESDCFPKPHVIDFNEKWEAECPVCKANHEKGILSPVVARTFETYIRSAFEYKQDGGKSFCDNLSKEADKVSQIKEILANDKVRD